MVFGLGADQSWEKAGLSMQARFIGLTRGSVLDVTLFSDDAERAEVDDPRDQRCDTEVEPGVPCKEACCDQC